MALRVKSKWFQKNKTRSETQLAQASAVVIWRIGVNGVKRMRQAEFAIDIGDSYFIFIQEWLIFLIHVADKVAFDHLGAIKRIHYTTILVKRLAELWAENKRDNMGGELTMEQIFIDAYNDRSDSYLSCDFDQGTPDYHARRMLAVKISELIAEDQRVWVYDQIIEIEGPDASLAVHQAILNLLAAAELT